MCDKHEIEGIDYELCDHCGEREQCGRLYAVWTSQDRSIHDYWCQECKDYDSYKCRQCGELFPETSGSVAIYAGEQDEYHYICFDCLLKEHGEKRDMLFLTEFIKDTDLNCYAPFFSAGAFEESIEMEQLRCLWTAYCLKYNYYPDTHRYDQILVLLYAELHAKYPRIFIYESDDVVEEEQSFFDNFDLFMGGHLV